MEAVKFTEPTSNAQFVAFTPPTRVEGPDGAAISAGSQTLVQFFRGIKVDKIIDGGYAATKGRGRQVNPDDVKTVRVEFDPESVNLEHAISGNIAPNDPQLQVLRDALDKDEAVNIAIETIRKSKNSDTKTPISPLTPIYALTGASEPGGKGKMDDAKQNVHKVVASVNGVTTVDCRSDATQWHVLQGNKTGTLPPEGFRFYSDKNDWKAYGVIVPEEAAPAAGNNANNVDFRAMAEYIIEQVGKNAQTTSPAGGNYVRRTPREDQIGEGRPFDVRNARGDVNLGSYVASKYHYTFLWAWKYLNDQLQSPPAEELANRLARTILALASEVQVGAYGSKRKADPSVNSHTLATRWVEWVIEERAPYTFNGEFPVEWRQKVTEEAVRHMRDSGEWVESLFAEQNAPVQQSAPTSTPDSDTSPQPQASTPEQAPADKRMERLNACIAAVNDKFDDVAGLRAIFHAAKNEGLLGAPVAYENKQVIFKNGSDLQLGDLITRRGKRLMENAASEQKNTPTPNEATTTPDVPAEPEDQSSDGNDVMSPEEFAAAMDASVEDSGDAESTDTAPSADDFSEDVPEDSGEETNADLGSLIEGITDRATAGAEWNKVRDSDHLGDSVTVNGEQTTVKDAFEALSKKFEEADAFVEEIVGITDPQALTPLRSKAKKAGVLELKVSDGSSDEEDTLDNVIKQTRASLKASQE